MSSTSQLPVITGEDTQPVRKPLWIDPPDQWENLDLLNYVALPAVGAQATILTFQVPVGRNGVIKKVANNYVGAGWLEGSGTLVWQILIDGAPPAGANSYASILASLGSPANPVEISGFRIYENQVLTVIIQNVAPGIVPAGQLCGARLVGYLYPKEMESDANWV